jgi:UDP-N-acetylmuramoylalanine--D-glutamate ligase
MIDVKDKKIVVLGAARSGLAVAKLLQKKQAKVFVSDKAEESKKQVERQILQDQQIDYEFGKHSNKIFDAEFAVLSPGISSHSRPRPPRY